MHASPFLMLVVQGYSSFRLPWPPSPRLLYLLRCEKLTINMDAASPAGLEEHIETERTEK